MNKWKKVISMTMAVCMTAAVVNPVVCSAEGNSNLTTLELFPMVGNGSIIGTVNNWVGDLLAEDLGVQVDVLDGGTEKLQALMASGELPDIMVFSELKQVEDAVNAGLLLNLDEYLDQLPNVTANAGNMINNFRDNASAGTGNLYALGTHILDTLPTRGVMNWGPWIRWDLYEQIGSPEIETLEDLIPVLKEMQELQPETEDGKKVYALSLWSDWDSSSNYMSFLSTIGSIYGRDYQNYLEIDVENKEAISMFDDNSIAMRALKFFFDANQAGLIDPDSMTQTYADYDTKARQQRTIFGFWKWSIYNERALEDQNIGFGALPITDSKVLFHGLRPAGMEWCYAVSKDAENPEAALALIDYMYSNEGIMKLANGPQGIIWDLDENGKPYVTEQGWEILNDKNGEMPTGGLITDGFDKPFLKGLDLRMINSDYGVAFDREYWDKSEGAPEDSPLTKQWQEDMDALDQMDYMIKNDKVAVKPLTIVQPVSDEMKQLNQRIGENTASMCWKCIYAENEEEFNELKEQMINEMMDKGLQESIDYSLAAYKAGLETGAKYDTYNNNN